MFILIIDLVKSKLWLVVICDRTISGTTWTRLEYYILDSYVDMDQNQLYSKVSAKTNTWKYTYIRGAQMGHIRQYRDPWYYSRFNCASGRSVVEGLEWQKKVLSYLKLNDEYAAAFVPTKMFLWKDLCMDPEKHYFFVSLWDTILKNKES